MLEKQAAAYREGFLGTLEKAAQGSFLSGLSQGAVRLAQGAVPALVQGAGALADRGEQLAALEAQRKEAEEREAKLKAMMEAKGLLPKQAQVPWGALGAGLGGVGAGLGAGYMLWGRDKPQPQPEAQPQMASDISQEMMRQQQAFTPEEWAYLQAMGQGLYEVPGYASYF